MSFSLLSETFAVLAGAAVGSFLNVVIWRLPRGESIVVPPSRCPSCGHAIRWFDNVPVLGWLFLRGRCRDCGGRISSRYPLVEALTALLAWLLFRQFGLSWAFAAAFLFAAALVAVTFIDLDHQIIPDVITLPGMPLGFLAGVFGLGLPWGEALLGLLLGGGCLWLVAEGYALATKREGMGGGDIKLLAMMGAFLGWKALPFLLLVSSLAGAVVGLTVMIAQGKDMKYALPFGPFLSLAAVAYLFVGPWFLSLFSVRLH